LRIGLAASGNPNHLNDQNRSLPSHLADQLAEIPGVVRLSPEVTGAKDFYDTARVVAGLDLVISVDTSIAHLSAAMGKPTWVLLPYIGVDWRWGGGVGSPWYPSARLFRQAASCDWTEVIDQVKSQLPPEA
jgi:hypothetical protein